jgi:hypothetical protein
VTRW